MVRLVVTGPADRLRSCSRTCLRVVESSSVAGPSRWPCPIFRPQRPSSGNSGAAPSYYRARYHDPTRSRFVSEDPIGFNRGINFYRYSQNSPVVQTDPFGEDAIVTLWPNGARGYGHVGIGVNSEQTSGYYPTERPTCLLFGCNVPGQILNDALNNPGETPKIIRIQTSAEEDRAMQAAMAQRTNTPGEYNLGSRNCAHFVEDVLNAGGVRGIPDTKYPKDLFRVLEAIAARQHQRGLSR